MKNRDFEKKIQRLKFRMSEAVNIYKQAHRIEKIEKEVEQMYLKKKIKAEEVTAHKKLIWKAIANIDNVISKIEEQVKQLK